MTTRLAAFDVIGEPKPQGNKTRMPSGAMVEGRSTAQRAKFKDWRNSVADKAREVAETVGCLDGDLSLHVIFRFRMPQSRPKAVREQGIAWKNSAPDLDKLLRTVGDALTQSGLIKDDARIVSVEARKIEVIDGWTGADIQLYRVDPS